MPGDGWMKSVPMPEDGMRWIKSKPMPGDEVRSASPDVSEVHLTSNDENGHEVQDPLAIVIQQIPTLELDLS